MNGVNGVTGGWPAIGIFRVAPGRIVEIPQGVSGGQTVLVAALNPPRTAAVSPIGALLPDVLARYGIATGQGTGEVLDAVA